MAKRRCFSIDVIESYEYLELSEKAKNLYTILILKADDDGVIINYRTPLKLLGFDEEVFTELLDTGFIIQVENIYVITHWNIHNQIPPSKKTPSFYQSQLENLVISQNKMYVCKL